MLSSTLHIALMLMISACIFTHFRYYLFLTIGILYVMHVSASIVKLVSFVISGVTDKQQEAMLMLTNGATRLKVSQCHQTWYHSIC